MHNLPDSDALEIVVADLTCAEHQSAVGDLIDAYAADPMGAGRPLDPAVRARLIPALRSHPTTEILLAYLEGRPVGIAVCFVGFSTFAGRPLLNVHDLAVLAKHRGRGVGRALLAAVERRADALQCCKVTLEVFEANPARRLYEAIGYRRVAHDEGAGGAALFLAKPL